ncbi:hypothetical protein HYPSUDRAFT_143687 [Hypholoma sublateritium FD-334 SS-4]|uniref:Chromosome transmission fidelity protein 8 n=1 Tax=Hypholoma sublateritium (strain FD-334 SS-4) TaxID=945553 RepID=A0A0D2NS64_HYPSF|nr:hypothetical protein HYPSUDRAFT_143687 [Hypholoma sublateritium FD-334 SS-4]
MLIPITLPAPGASGTAHPKLPSALARIAHDELVLIELQGALDVELTHARERDGRFVGTLSIDDAATRPSLLIGNHLLEGKIAVLPKPYAVLVRNGGPARGSDADADADEDADAMQASAGWTVRGIVKKKIVFSKRPMPVMGKKLPPS